MDILTILKKDHNTVKDLLNQLLDEKPSPKKRETLMQQLEKEILAHSKAEEMVLYPELRAEKSTRSLALEAHEEHELVEYLLNKTKDIDPSDKDTMHATIKVLRETLEHHIKEEESEIFKQCRKNFSKEDLQDLGEDFLEAKNEIIGVTSESSEDFGEENMEDLAPPEKKSA